MSMHGKISVIILGAGGRGTIYANLIKLMPDKAEVVAVAEPRDFFRNRVVAEHHIPEVNSFTDWRDVLKRPKFADAVIITTQDRMHVEPAIAFANMGYNILLYIICGIVIESWILPLYSIVTYMAALKMVDTIVEGLDRAKSVYIVTTRHEAVCEVLSKTFEKGITVMKAQGYYSGLDRKVVWIVLNRFQISRMREQVHEVDPAAYETVTRYVYRSAGLKDQLMASGDMMNGYVVDCVATPHITYVEQPDGTVAAVESTGDDTRLDLLFTIEVYVTDTVRNTVGTQEVRTGKKHVVKTSHFEFEEGVILSCVWDEAD